MNRAPLHSVAGGGVALGASPGESRPREEEAVGQSPPRMHCAVTPPPPVCIHTQSDRSFLPSQILLSPFPFSLPRVFSSQVFIALHSTGRCWGLLLLRAGCTLQNAHGKLTVEQAGLNEVF